MIEIDKIFSISSEEEFNAIALEIFHFQAENNPIYKEFLSHLKVNPNKIDELDKIPFLPITFYKNHKVVSAAPPYELIFKSSGTTGTSRSTHFVKAAEIYEKSFMKGFEHFFGPASDYTILALLPSYLEQGDSSLVYMVNQLMKHSNEKYKGFFLHNFQELAERIKELESLNKKTLLLGVSYALLDFVEAHQFNLKNTLVMETGGMKGRKKEMLREELHTFLKKGFGVDKIYSEYGMTELLSQSYSAGEGIFQSPPWKKIIIRDTEDPFTALAYGKSGGINIIDLANIYSCSFLSTQDLGKMYPDESFEILGRFDHSDIRGCNLLIQ